MNPGTVYWRRTPLADALAWKADADTWAGAVGLLMSTAKAATKTTTASRPILDALPAFGPE
jgi:hypothetical protein